ncbi:MAG: hypothetical protein JRF33_08425 [Deltaproteobacteria bacterium]|nr:hypothetical protein [Deltaproteobacteria bacterium]
MSDKNREIEADSSSNPTSDEAEQRKNAIKLIVLVFVIPLLVVGISLATR